MQEADESSPASLSKCLRRLDQFDVFGPWSLLPTSFGVRHSLSFVELFECHPFEVRRVEEQVLASFGVNKPKTLLRHFLDRAFCHRKSNSSKITKLDSKSTPFNQAIQRLLTMRKSYWSSTKKFSESVADITLDALVEGDSSDLVLIERFEGDEWDG